MHFSTSFLGTLESLPIPMIAVSQDSKDFMLEWLSAWNRHSVGDRRSVIVHRVPNVHRATEMLGVSVKSVGKKERKQTRAGETSHVDDTMIMCNPWALQLLSHACSRDEMWLCCVQLTLYVLYFVGLLFTHPFGGLEVSPGKRNLS